MFYFLSRKVKLITISSQGKSLQTEQQELFFWGSVVKFMGWKNFVALILCVCVCVCEKCAAGSTLRFLVRHTQVILKG